MKLSGTLLKIGCHRVFVKFFKLVFNECISELIATKKINAIKYFNENTTKRQQSLISLIFKTISLIK